MLGSACDRQFDPAEAVCLVEITPEMFDPERFGKRTGLKLTDPDRLDASRISPAIHEGWRAPRRGTANPERMTNPLWEWLVRFASDGCARVTSGACRPV